MNCVNYIDGWISLQLVCKSFHNRRNNEHCESITNVRDALFSDLIKQCKQWQWKMECKRKSNDKGPNILQLYMAVTQQHRHLLEKDAFL